MTGIKQAFGKGRRILKNAEFRRIFKQGRRFNLPELTLVIHPSRNPEPAPARLGLSISRKVGDAPVRNRLKRRVREIFRLNQGRFEPGSDVVLVGRKETADLRYLALQTALLGLCDRGKVLRKGIGP